MNPTRRRFLTATAAGLATPAALGAGLPTPPAARAQTYRIALIGCGWWGNNILNEAMAAGQAKVVGLCDVDANILERRIMSLTEKTMEARRGKRIAIVAVCGAMALATCFSAMALRINVDDPAAQTARPKSIHVSADNLKTTYKKTPVYPVEAKTNHDTLDGSVVLAVTIGKDGVVENINVKKSLRGDYDQSAIDAVRQWKYRPYLLSGRPVETETQVQVNFVLQ